MIQFFCNDTKGLITITKIDDNSFNIKDFIQKFKKRILRYEIDKLPYRLYIKSGSFFNIITELSILNIK